MPRTWLSPLTQVPGMDTGAYATGDAVGVSFTLNVPQHGIIHSARLFDQSDQEIALDIVMFDAAITSGTNNDTYDMADADASKYIGHLSITNADYASFADNAVAVAGNFSIVYTINTGTMTIQVVTRGAPTYAAVTDLSIAIGVIIP